MYMHTLLALLAHVAFAITPQLGSFVDLPDTTQQEPQTLARPWTDQLAVINVIYQAITENGLKAIFNETFFHVAIAAIIMVAVCGFITRKCQTDDETICFIEHRPSAQSDSKLM